MPPLLDLQEDQLHAAAAANWDLSLSVHELDLLRTSACHNQASLAYLGSAVTARRHWPAQPNPCSILKHQLDIPVTCRLNVARGPCTLPVMRECW